VEEASRIGGRGASKAAGAASASEYSGRPVEDVSREAAVSESERCRPPKSVNRASSRAAEGARGPADLTEKGC